MKNWYSNGIDEWLGMTEHCPQASRTCPINVVLDTLAIL